MENNTRQTKIFEVAHEIHTKKGVKKLVDPRDIYELVANNGARRMRACILGIIPGDITEAAEEECKKTLQKGDGKPLTDRIRKMLDAYKDLGVSQEMIEKRLAHPLDLTTADEIVQLTGIFMSIRDKHAARADFFDFPSDAPQDTKSSKLSEKVAEKAKAPAPAPEAASSDFEKAVEQTPDPRKLK